MLSHQYVLHAYEYTIHQKQLHHELLLAAPQRVERAERVTAGGVADLDLTAPSTRRHRRRLEVGARRLALGRRRRAALAQLEGLRILQLMQRQRVA